MRISAKEEERGPEEAQHTVLRHIGERYEDIIGAIAPLLRREYDAARGGDDSLPKDVAFNLEELSIPETETDSMKWEMRFYCDDGGEIDRASRNARSSNSATPMRGAQSRRYDQSRSALEATPRMSLH